MKRKIHPNKADLSRETQKTGRARSDAFQVPKGYDNQPRLIHPEKFTIIEKARPTSHNINSIKKLKFNKPRENTGSNIWG